MRSVHELKEKIAPTVLVIFGATGDLSRQRLIPALCHLSAQKLLPREFAVFGFARSRFSNEEFRGHVGQTIRESLGRKYSQKSWGKFAKKIFYSPGNFDNREDFVELADQIHKLEKRGLQKYGKYFCPNRLFYFSTLQKFYENISRELDSAGLLTGCSDPKHERSIRVVVEKPFGSDQKSAKNLDKTLHKYFDEEQIYRIDHYLGKETVQNLITTRFGNSIFEPIWNRNYIDHIQISSLQGEGVGSRGAFYEEAGATRDVMQNHLMQLLALIAMEPPNDLSTESLRDERAKVIKAIAEPKPTELKNLVITGQYRGYAAEKNVSPRSRVETFSAVKLFIDNSRWAGVPFYLRTGKKLKQKISEVSIHFKPVAPHLFGEQQIPNILTFRIQPDEAIFLKLAAKTPGFGIRLHPVTMQLGYKTAFEGEIPEAYERLLLDFMQGDQRLFARTDEIEHSWKYIDVIEKHLQKTKPQVYTPGGFGPKQANNLIEKDNRAWHIHQ